MTPIVLVLVSVLLLVTVMSSISAVSRRFNLDPEIARKTIHVGLGLYCLTFPLLFQENWPVVAVCTLAILVMIAARTWRSLRESMGQGLLGVARQSYGDVLFALAVALTFVLQKGEVVSYLLPLTILTLSDAAAAIVGTCYGRNLFSIEIGRKSWEGVVIFFLTACIVTLILLLLFSDAQRESVVVLGLVIASYGTLVEATSWRGWDNLLVPLALNMLLAQHLHDAPLDLIAGAVCFSVILAILSRWGSAIGFDPHSAVFVATVLLAIGLASSFWNIVLPGAAILCHGIARRRWNLGEFPHLRLSLAMIGLSLIWYIVTDRTHLGTVYAFNMTFAALGVGFLALSAERIISLFMLLPAIMVMLALVHVMAFLAPGWTPLGVKPIGLSGGILMVLCPLVILGRYWFAKDWVPRLGAVALIAGVAAMPLAQR